MTTGYASRLGLKTVTVITTGTLTTSVTRGAVVTGTTTTGAARASAGVGDEDGADATGFNDKLLSFEL